MCCFVALSCWPLCTLFPVCKSEGVPILMGSWNQSTQVCSMKVVGLGVGVA
jgi:hypothetical protein